MRKILDRSGKLFVAIAAVWALGTSLYIFLLPVSVHGTRDVLMRDSSRIVETFAREQSWYEAHGLWSTLWLGLFGGIYLLSVWFAWREKGVELTVVSVAVVALSIITGFSIGSAYLPAALGLSIGALIILSSRLVPNRC